MIESAKQRFADLKASGMLPSPKGVALAVLELTQQPDANIQSLTKLVQTDPAMAARLLRYANAAHGGSLRHIASLPHAIVFLGLFRIRQIALGFSLIDHYRQGACRGFDYLGYWTASLATGITAQLVSHQAQCPPDESFTCGLLADIGRLALATAFPTEYAEILERHPAGQALSAAELNQFGLDHSTLSAELLEDWGLPEIFHQAVRFHETPSATPFTAGSRVQVLTCALHFAAKVGQLLNLDASKRWERVPSLYQAAAQLGMEDHEVSPLVEQVIRQWQDWGRELRLPTADFQDTQSLLSLPPEPGTGGEIAALVVLPMRVAIVARHAKLLNALASALDAMGLSVDLAPDRASALKVLQQNRTDVMMVELSGADEQSTALLRELRTSEGGRHAYCVAMIPPSAEGQVAQLMMAGASDYLTLPYTEGALLARLNGAQRVVALQGAVRAERESSIRSSGEWARSNRRLMQEALTDSLTQLPNRRYGMDRLNQEWSFAEHNGTELACLMLDIDHFKRINDQYGHDTGDAVLAQFARILEHRCRKNDVVFRYGGEEFCIVCPNTRRDEARLLGERIVEAVRVAQFGESEQTFKVTVSAGIAARCSADAAPENLLARADQALYAAKNGGRNQAVVAAAP